MKFVIEVDSEIDTDAVGEHLRSAFFDETTRPGYDGHPRTGGYTSFDWAEGVEPLPTIDIEELICQRCQEIIDAYIPVAPAQPMDTDYECLCVHETHWTRGRKLFLNRDGTPEPMLPIECRYWWDEDGTLAFGLPDGKWLVNTDCKCDHGWEICEEVEVH